MGISLVSLSGTVHAIHVNNNINANTVTSTFNAVLTKVSDEVLGLYHPKKKPWITVDILAHCVERRKLKKHNS